MFRGDVTSFCQPAMVYIQCVTIHTTTTIGKSCLTLFINYARCRDLACIIVCLRGSVRTILLCINVDLCSHTVIENLCVANEDVFLVERPVS